MIYIRYSCSLTDNRSSCCCSSNVDPMVSQWQTGTHNLHEFITKNEHGFKRPAPSSVFHVSDDS